MIRKLILAAAISSSLLSGGVGFAAPRPTPPAPNAQPAPPPPPGGPRGPMQADTNRDGVITRDEAMAEAGRMFAMRDANHDGRLAGDEMGPPRGPRADGPPPPRGGDAKGRQITRAKFERRMMRRFDKLDANRDGQVARTEIKAHRQQKRDQRMQAPGAAPRSGADDRG